MMTTNVAAEQRQKALDFNSACANVSRKPRSPSTTGYASPQRCCKSQRFGEPRLSFRGQGKSNFFDENYGTFDD